MYYVHFLSSCFTITSKTDKVFFIKYFKGILDFGYYHLEDYYLLLLLLEVFSLICIA